MNKMLYTAALLLFGASVTAQEFNYGQVCYDTSEYTEEDWELVEMEGIDTCWGAGTTFTYSEDTNELSVFDHWNGTTNTFKVLNCGTVDGYLLLQDDTSSWRLSEDEGHLTGVQSYYK